MGASSDDRRGVIDEGALRALVPRVLAGLVRRGEDFDAAEDALQEALLEALRVWPEHPPHDPRAWLITVATRRLVDARRSETARQRREETIYTEEQPAPTEEGDDTLFLLFCCCHPDLAPTSQVALTLRAVGGLSTREIADAFYVPEATMAQRISRAKRTLQGRRLDQPGDLAVVLRVLYLVYTAGHTDRVDLAAEAIRLARQLTLATEEPEARGLLALMLLNHARLPARFDSQGRIVTLDRQDRGLWDTREIAEGVRVLQSALALQRPGRYQIEAAIAALHGDAASAEETDWPQILAWYDDLVALTDDPVRQDPAAVLGRAVAVGHVRGPAAGLRETDRLRDVIDDRHRWHAVRGHLHELDGDLPAAATAYAEAARRATNVAERDHLVRQAARARAANAGSPPVRQVRALHDEETLVVYQAYSPAIAEPALAAGTFVAPFKRERMTWIKPSFLWMMYRCGWATKPDQERVLAITITRAGFEWALAHSSLSHEREQHGPGPRPVGPGALGHARKARASRDPGRPRRRGGRPLRRRVDHGHRGRHAAGARDRAARGRRRTRRGAAPAAARAPADAARARHGAHFSNASLTASSTGSGRPGWAASRIASRASGV